MSVWDWLIGEAGAGWILGLAGIAGALYTWLNREKPPKIIVQEVEVRQLLNIHESRIDRLKASYDSDTGEKVDLLELSQLTFVIYNAGTKGITESIDLELEIRSFGINLSLEFIDILFDENSVPKPTSTMDTFEDRCSVILTIPYLNSLQQHDHVLNCHVISPTPVTVSLKQRRSAGIGWSSIGITIPEYDKFQQNLGKRIDKTIFSLVVLLLIAYVTKSLAEPIFFFFLALGLIAWTLQKPLIERFAIYWLGIYPYSKFK